jgi:ankyrin repeat protein
MAMQRKWVPIVVVLGVVLVIVGIALYRVKKSRHQNDLLNAAAAAIENGDAQGLRKAIATLDPDSLYGATGSPSLASQLMGDHEIEHGSALLMMACGCHRLLDLNQTCAPLVQTLIDRGARADIMGAYGKTPLMAACEYGDFPTVKILLDHGARAQVKDANGFSPLFLAVHNQSNPSRNQIVAALLAHGADPNSEAMGGTPIQMTSDYEVISMLVAAGADVNRIWHTITPLMVAARNGNLKTVKLLADHGAQLDLRDARGRDAAAFAQLSHHPDIVRLLQSRRHQPALAAKRP